MFTKKDSVLALDFGAGSIKALRLGMDRGMVVLEAVGGVSVPEADNERGSADDREYAFAAALRGLLRQTGTECKKIRHVTSSLSGSQVGVKQIRTAKLSDDELRSSLVFEARKHMPVKGEVLLDYQVIADDSEEADVLLAVTTREAVESHGVMLESAGLKAGVIDAPSLALANAVTLAGRHGDQSFAIIQIGATVTRISLCTAKRQFFTRDIPVAGKHFTEEIKRQAQCDTATAEQRKREAGALHAAAPQSAGRQHGGIALALASAEENKTMDSLSRELQRSMRFFLKESGLRSVEASYITGGAAADASLRDRLERELRTTLTEMDPFAWAGVQTKLDAAGRHEFSQALGLGLRRIYELFPDKFKQTRR
jgi:type IV pilus assembly protein PilM